MPDVFISYARATEESAKRIEATLAALGYRVWRDDQLPAHRAYAEVIEERLANAKAVVVIWSAEAVQSEWVRSEANRAREARKIVQLRVDATRLPMPFDQIQCADFLGWQGEDDHAGWRTVAASVAALVRGEAALASAVPASDSRPVPAPARPPQNLPAQLTSFVGRERERQEVVEHLAASRLVTLTGSGGAGKTRLSLQVGHDLAGRYRDGVWLVELAALGDPQLVPQAMASVLGVKEVAGSSLRDTLGAELRDREMLVLLDNCEHLVAAVAALCASLLSSCPRLRFLASSREALRIAGEVAYRVPSLAVPAAHAAADAESLSRYAAVQLLVDRARAVKPAFELDERSAPAVAEICRRLDGIPLAIELAAARLRSLTAQELGARLDQRFRVLTGGARTALPRQQTLRALIDWSYDLLGEEERTLLRRVAVFAGGWTLEAAERVCTGDGEDESAVVDLLASLVDKSLVFTEEREGATRYRLPETVQAYARDRLQETGDEARWHARHFAHFLAFARAADVKLRDADSDAARQMDLEHDNLRAALSRPGAPDGNARAAIDLVSVVWWYWFMRGFWSEGRRWVEAALDRVPPGEHADLVWRARFGAGRLAMAQDDYAAARPHLEAVVDHCRANGKQGGLSNGLRALGSIAYSRCEFDTARQCYDESLAISRQIGDPFGIGATVGNLGRMATLQGEWAEARRLLAESLEAWRGLGNWHGEALSVGFLARLDFEVGDLAAARRGYESCLAVMREHGGHNGAHEVMTFLGNLEAAEGRWAAARSALRESLEGHRKVGDRTGIASALEGLAIVALGLAEFDLAAVLLGGAERLREEMGAPCPPIERQRLQRSLVAAQPALGDPAAFDERRRAGLKLPLERVIAVAMGSAPA